MIDAEMRALTAKEEGNRLDAYPDSRGNLTIGKGHLLVKGSTIPQAAVDIIFDADYDKAIRGYRSLGLTLDDVRRQAVIDMVFELGVGGVMGFHHFLAALGAQKWQEAADELMDSAYARQVPARAARNRDKILKGEPT